MDRTEIYISSLLQIISKEDKAIIMLMDDINIDLLNYDTNTDSTTFLGSMYTNLFLPYILTPTHVTRHCKTLLIIYFETILRMV